MCRQSNGHARVPIRAKRGLQRYPNQAGLTDEQIGQTRKIRHRHITAPGKGLTHGNGRVKTFRQTGR